jgi:hypothetical protein
MVCNYSERRVITNMSRSCKKEPVVKDYNRNSKKYANRRVRRVFKDCDYPNGNAYRKLCCSWDICDYKFRETYKEYKIRKRRYELEYINGAGRYGILCDFSKDMSYWDWYKTYKRK